MANDHSIPASDQSAEDTPVRSQSRESKLLALLSVVVGIETVVIIGLAAVVGFLAGDWWHDKTTGYVVEPSAGEQRIWMIAEQMGSAVSYCISDNDLQTYLEMYDPTDPHVDMGEVEADFTAIVTRLQEAEGAVNYGTSSMPVIYTDTLTDSTIVQLTLSGSDWESGRPAGGRLTIYVLVDGTDMTLTGKEGRELEFSSTVN